MTIARKLQMRNGQRARVINAPDGFELDANMVDDATAELVLAFVVHRAEVASRAAAALQAGRDDRLAWIAYPKAGQLGTDLNRDILWDELRTLGVRPVRQIALDETWSALRLRPA